MSSLTEEEIKNIGQRCKLEEIQQELLHKYLRKSKVHKLMIRQILCEQSKQSKQAYYLLEGNVNLMATLVTGQKTTISQVSQHQFLNLQIILNSWKNKYTIIPSSSFIKYLVFQEKQIRMIVQNIRQDIEQISRFRQKELVKKNKKANQQLRKKKMEDQINKLSLPNINLQSIQRHSNLLQNSQSLEENIKSLENLPAFSKHGKKTVKSQSVKKLGSISNRIQVPQTYEESNLQAISEKLINHFHEYKDKITQKKLVRLKSERSVSLNDKEPKQINYSRNEKIFKEHLKQIVKRKLMFERKHFKILKRFNNKDKNNEEPQYHDRMKRYEDERDNPIDNYFNI